MFVVILWLPLADLPENLQSRIDAGSIRAIPSPNDCICLVKQYLGSEQLAQTAVVSPHRSPRSEGWTCSIAEVAEHII